MYKHNDHYLKFCILQRCIGLTINAESKLCRLDFLVVRGRCVEKQRLLSFQNEHLFVFYEQQSTQNDKENVGSMNEVVMKFDVLIRLHKLWCP